MKKVIVTFYWLDNHEPSSIVITANPNEKDTELAAKAFSALGFGGGATKALDYFNIELDESLGETLH